MLEYCCTILRAVPLPQEKSSPRKLPCTLRTRTCRRTLCWQVCGVRVFAAIPLPTVGPGATAGAVRADRSPVQSRTRPQKAAAVSGLRCHSACNIDPRIASPANVTLMAPLRLTIRCRLIGRASWLSRLARREGLWAGRALHSPSRPQTRAMGQRSWCRPAAPERPTALLPSF